LYFAAELHRNRNGRSKNMNKAAVPRRQSRSRGRM
jgi:hypothetical protein